jgi:hypothetical protein
MQQKVVLEKDINNWTFDSRQLLDKFDENIDTIEVL